MIEESYDVIIIGGGPAGLTAGIYASRHGLKTLILEKAELGGKSWGAHAIENYPGFPEGISGTELMKRFIAQTKKFGAEIKKETVIGLNILDETKIIQTRGGFYQSKAIILATGIQKKQLSIPGEMDFKGRGVSYCAICDGPFFKDKIVAVVGSNEEAIEDALKLTEVAEKVYVIPAEKKLEKESKELLRHPKIELMEGAEIMSIGGESVVTHINLKKDGEEMLHVDGVFIILENVPTTDILRDSGIETDARGCIIVDGDQSTNIEGIYASGDCVCGGMQIVTAAGDGGKAGLSVLKYLRSLNK